MSEPLSQIHATPEQLKAVLAEESPRSLTAALEESATEPEPEPEPEISPEMRAAFEQRLADHPEWSGSLPHPEPETAKEFSANAVSLDKREQSREQALQQALTSVEDGEDFEDIATAILSGDHPDVLEDILPVWIEEEPDEAAQWIAQVTPFIDNLNKSAMQAAHLEAEGMAQKEADAKWETFTAKHPRAEQITGLMDYVSNGGLHNLAHEGLIPESEVERIYEYVDKQSGEEQLETYYQTSIQLLRAANRQQIAQNILGAGKPRLLDELGNDEPSAPPSAKFQFKTEEVFTRPGIEFDTGPEELRAELDRWRKETAKAEKAAREEHERAWGPA